MTATIDVWILVVWWPPNPIRYRGYYYDAETNLYYCQSRYYNPQWRRFLNADSMFDTGHGVLGTNMYAYCENNPINFIDINGKAMSPIASTGLDKNGMLMIFMLWWIDDILVGVRDNLGPAMMYTTANSIASTFNMMKAVGASTADAVQYLFSLSMNITDTIISNATQASKTLALENRIAELEKENRKTFGKALKNGAWGALSGAGLVVWQSTWDGEQIKKTSALGGAIGGFIAGIIGYLIVG